MKQDKLRMHIFQFVINFMRRFRGIKLFKQLSCKQLPLYILLYIITMYIPYNVCDNLIPLTFFMTELRRYNKFILLQVKKFKDMISTIGADVLAAIATAGPANQVKMI